MKKTRITVSHQLEKTKHNFLVVNPDKLSRIESKRIMKKMGVSMLLVNGKLYTGQHVKIINAIYLIFKSLIYEFFKYDKHLFV